MGKGSVDTVSIGLKGAKEKDVLSILGSPPEPSPGWQAAVLGLEMRWIQI